MLQVGGECDGKIRARLVCIDVLRGVAILAVMLMHIPHDAPGGFRENPWFFPAWGMDFGYLGVHLFVLISGFCIHRRAAIAKSSSGAYDVSWRRFWVRRFWRLYPPYVFAIVLSVVAAMFLHDRSQAGAHPRIADFIAHFFMVHNLFREFATSLGNGAFWSLGMEEQLYALYAILLIMFRRAGYVTSCAIVCSSTLVWRFLWPWLPEQTIAEGFTLGKFYLWPLMFWMHWTLGAIAAEGYFGSVKLPAMAGSKVLTVIMICGGVLLNANTFEFVSSTNIGRSLKAMLNTAPLQSISSLGEFALGIGLFLLLNQSLSRERGLTEASAMHGFRKLLAGLGRISYSIYLTHVPVLFIVEDYLSLAPSILAWPVRVGLSLVACVSVGIFFFYSVERWFLAGTMPRPSRQAALESTGVSVP